jgi:signal transduction histidine kinase
VAGALSAAVLILTVALSAPSYQSSPFEQSVPDWLVGLGVAAGASLVAAAWVERHTKPAVAIGLGVVTIALFVPTWAGWSWLPASAQAWALAMAPLAVAGATQVGTRWSHGRQSPRTLSVIWGLTIAATVIHGVGYNPLVDPSCATTCADVAPVAAGVMTTPLSISIVTTLVAGAGVVAVTALAFALSAGRSRGIASAALAAVLLLFVPGVTRAITWTTPPSPTDQFLPWALAGLILGTAPLVATLRTRRIRAEMERLVEQLARDGSTCGPAFDPQRRIEFSIPGEDDWVDAQGNPVQLEAEHRDSVVVADAGGPMLRLRLSPDDDPGDVLAALTPTTLLGLHNARLAAISRARMADVRASQRRIVAASNAERERIERDLHDGAQQRVVSAAFHLSLARHRLSEGGSEPADGGLADADAAVREALAGLRALGHGIFPAVLTTEGLGAALEDLARESRVHTTLDVPALDLERDVAIATYAVVAATLSAAEQDGDGFSAAVATSVSDGWLHLVVRLSGNGTLSHVGFVDVADRVGALGGRLALDPIEGGFQVSAEVPCA